MTARTIDRIPAAVAAKLEAYVYLLVDPRDGQVFYVGKGRGQRCLDHLNILDDSSKSTQIRDIRAAGLEPRIDILVHGLDDDSALRVEASVIDVLKLETLTNRVRGHGVEIGRARLQDVIDVYSSEPVTILEPTLLIRINQLYRFDMTPTALYDATRGVWKIGPRREQAKYACAVYQGIVREMYEILAWFPGGSTMNSRPHENVHAPDRWEFIGNLAPDGIRRKYVGQSVAASFPKNTQNPFVYINC
jgi:uncharacterized protein